MSCGMVPIDLVGVIRSCIADVGEDLSIRAQAVRTLVGPPHQSNSTLTGNSHSILG
jgi:hypothetical protein